MSDFLWSRLALSAGIQFLERLVLLMAILMLGATVISCWRSWTYVTPRVRAWAPLPARFEPASKPYGARQLIRSYPSAMNLGVGSSGALHVGLALLAAYFLAFESSKSFVKPPTIFDITWETESPMQTIPQAQKTEPAPFSLPDPRNAIPTPVDHHLALMDSSDMVLASITTDFGTPIGFGFDNRGGLDGLDGPLGSKLGLGHGTSLLDDPDPSQFIQVDQLPELVWMQEPGYPEMARRGGLEGVVQVLVLVSRDGGAKSTRLVRSIPGLDEAAVSAAATARFKPALWMGRPVAVWVSMPIRFTLN